MSRVFHPSLKWRSFRASSLQFRSKIRFNYRHSLFIVHLKPSRDIQTIVSKSWCLFLVLQSWSGGLKYETCRPVIIGHVLVWHSIKTQFKSFTVLNFVNPLPELAPPRGWVKPREKPHECMPLFPYEDMAQDRLPTIVMLCLASYWLFTFCYMPGHFTLVRPFLVAELDSPMVLHDRGSIFWQYVRPQQHKAGGFLSE